MWVQLKQGDDWGNKYLAVKPLGSAGTASVSRGIKVQDGEKVEIRWPDGTEETVVVKMQGITSHINDMGHEYDVRSQLPVFEAKLHGVKICIGLDQVKIKKDWVEKHEQ